MVMVNRWICACIVILLVIIQPNQACSLQPLQNLFSSAIISISDFIKSFLKGNETISEESSSSSSKEIAKRKELYDKFYTQVFAESSMVTKIHDVLDKNFDKFTERLLRIFPTNKQSVIKNYLKTIPNAEENDWKFFNIMYTNEETNTVKYFSLYGNHVEGKSNIYFIDFESNFHLPQMERENDKDNVLGSELLAISASSLTQEEKQDIKSLPRGMSILDIKKLLSIVKRKAITEMKKSLPNTFDHPSTTGSNADNTSKKKKDEM